MKRKRLTEDNKRLIVQLFMEAILEYEKEQNIQFRIC